MRYDINSFHRLPKKDKAIIFIERPDIIIEIAKDILPPERFAHSMSVADLAMTLAKRYHADYKKAYIAGALHDITKPLSKNEHLDYLRYYDVSRVGEPEAVLHSFSAPYFIKEKFNYYDSDVLNAIYHHTYGTSKAMLAKILYIADKREPLRGIKDDILDMAFQDIHKAFDALKKDVEEYVANDRKSKIHN